MKKPDPLVVKGNKKGQGFHLFKAPTEDREFRTLRKYMLIGGTLVTGGIFALLLVAGQHATLDFTLMITALFALCATLIYDIASRRLWEKKISRRLDKLSGHHDRLVREVARNRGDISFMKEGLGQLAQSVEKQGARLAPATSVEGKMIETIVTRLGAMGDKPRADVNTPQAAAILELEMAPPPSRPPPLSELDDELAPDLSKYSDAAIAKMVRDAVRDDHIDVFLQPVVALPQRKTRIYEAYARIRAAAGIYLPAAHYLAMAKREDLIPAIDNRLLLRTLEMLRDRRNNDKITPYVLNVSGASLSDRGFMGDLVTFLSKNHHMAGRLIFELPQKELEEHAQTLKPLLDGLSKLGCRFSMDRIRRRKIDINMLKALHIRFIKLDAGWLVKEGGTRSGFSRIIRMKKQLDHAGIDLVVERIENEATLRELLDYGIDYGQGYLFGKPDHYAAYREPLAAA